MLNHLYFAHQQHLKGESPPILASQAISWKTCIRELVFVSNAEQLTMLAGDHYQGAKAYEFLLQLICGLHSPLIGETAVLGQFKIFIKQHPKCLSEKVSQQLLKDAKKLRTNYLTNFGGQSYGSYTLSQSKSADSIVMIGSGALTFEILPIVKKFKGELVVQARSLEKAGPLKEKYPHIVLETLHSMTKIRRNALVVIAAPIETTELEKYLDENFAHSKILDMRALGHHKPLQLESHFTTQNLEAIFTHIKTVQNKMQVLAEVVKDKIEIMALAKVNQVMSRPFGWEDLCY
jgi:glutamyl-tRNA reductase